MKNSNLITIYGIPNCGSVKKGRDWFSENGIEYQFHDFKKQGIDQDTLRHWLNYVNWEVLVNRKGTTWRGLAESVKTGVTDAQSALEVMLENPSVIKRPVIVKNNHIIVGVNPDEWANVIQ